AKHEHMLSPVQAGELRAALGEPVRSIALREPFGFALRGVTFAYPGKDSADVSDLSFDIPAGRVTAIVGESGAGKSTVASIICGLYRPKQGWVEVLGADGTPTGIRPQVLSARIAIVPQEPFLFAGTILENITFGRESITEAQAQQAAAAARIHDYVLG